MLRFCENTYRFIGILCVLKQGVTLGIKEVFTPMRLCPVVSRSDGEGGIPERYALTRKA
jgi:hypothetical protein